MIDPNLWQRAINDGIVSNIPQERATLNLQSAVKAYYAATDATYITTEDYYQSIPTMRLDTPPVESKAIVARLVDPQERVPSFFRALLVDSQVALATLATLIMIGEGYNYFLYHQTEGNALLAALVIGAFIWATLSPKKGN